MKLIIAGSRHINPSREEMTNWIMSACEGFDWHFENISIISGGAAGVDRAAEDWARWWGRDFELYEADWETHGRKAGPIRNAQMAASGDGLLLIWDSRSKGSANMLKTWQKEGKKYMEVII